MEVDGNLALKEYLPNNHDTEILKMVEIARQGVLKYGTTSEAYLMKKLKCTKSTASMIMKQIIPHHNDDYRTLL